MKNTVLLLITVLLILTSCSLEKLVYKKAADVLSTSGNSTVFTGEEDPVLIAESLPLMLKLYELVLEKNQDDAELQLVTGGLFVMYANAFVQGPADLLDDEDYALYRAELKRAKLHYLRARKHIIRALEVRQPGFLPAMQQSDFKSAFIGFDADDSGLLYWFAASLLGAVSTDPLDSSLSAQIPQAFASMLHVLEMNERYGDGTIHELFLSLYTSIPEYIFMPADPEPALVLKNKASAYYSKYAFENTGYEEKTDFHFKKAIEYADGLHAGAYISYASGVAIKNNDPDLFRELLEKALAIDVDKKPESRLANILAMKKARKMLAETGDIFLLD